MKYRLSSIRSQMILVFIIFSIVISAGIGLICFWTLYNSMYKQAVDASVNAVNQLNIETEVMIAKATKLLQWGDSIDVENFFYAQDRIAETRQLIETVKNYRLSKIVDDTVNNIYLFDVDGTSYNERIGIYHNGNDLKSQIILEKITENPENLIYISGDEIGEAKDIIVVGRDIRQHATRMIIGRIAVEFKPDAITGLFDQTSFWQTGSFFVASSEGTVVLGNKTEEAQQIAAWIENMGDRQTEYTVLQNAYGQLLVVLSPIQNTGWRLVGYVPVKELMDEFSDILELAYLNIIITLCLALFLYAFISKKLTAPIVRLKDHMLQVADGNLDAVIEPVSNNEFSTLEIQYNRMLNDLQLQIEQNKKEQENLKKAEFKALQAQINPHFLYNTLDTIIWLVAVNENDKAIETIEQLSIFFKIGLSKGMEWISVQEEINHLYSYLYIQQIRYSDLLKFVIQTDQDIQSYEMLKMTLQPIVENAIYHGIKNKKQGGKIRIRGYINEIGHLIFIISDTGIGMKKQTRLQLIESLDKNDRSFEDKENGFGLYNVNKRIKLYYGEPYGISIWSKLGLGTVVTIRLHVTKKGEQSV